jgi:hypothetical protein
LRGHFYVSGPTLRWDPSVGAPFVTVARAGQMVGPVQRLARAIPKPKPSAVRRGVLGGSDTGAF